MVQSNVGQRRDERSLLSTVFKSLCFSHLVASTPIGVIASFADFLNKGKCESTEDPAEGLGSRLRSGTHPLHSKLSCNVQCNYNEA